MTAALAELAGTPLPKTIANELEALAPSAVEWSVNADQRRGRLRVAAWSSDVARVDAALARLGEPRAREWHHRCAAAATVESRRQAATGIGWQLAADEPARARWWQLAPLSDGAALYATALASAPELRGPGEALVALTGSSSRCVAVGAELANGEVARATLYFELLAPALAVELLGHLRIPPSPRARSFFAELESWTQIWVARSVGRHGGWKFYRFLRNESARPDDAALLDQLDAGAVRPFVTCAREMCGASDIVQIAGITFFEADRGGTPQLTLYLAAH